MSSPRNQSTEQRRGHKGTITEIKVTSDEVTQECLAKVSQSESDQALLAEQIRQAKRKINAILDRGGKVEPGPLRVVRGPKGHIKIY